LAINYNELRDLIDLKQCPHLNYKYKDVVSLPLDLEPFVFDNETAFWDLWTNENHVVWRNHIDRGSANLTNPDITKTQWHGLALHEDMDLYEHGSWGTKITEEAREISPIMVQRMFDELPFVRIRSIRLWSAHKQIPAHYDGNMPDSLDGKMFFPTEIRIMLQDENPKPTFWLTSAKAHKPNTEVPTDQKHYVVLPEGTNTFAWNNEDYLHGADFDGSNRKILAVVKGWVDLTKLETLLDKSIAKYPDFVVKI